MRDKKGGDKVKQYLVKVTRVVYLFAEADDPQTAVDWACEHSWEYDADEMEGEIVEETMEVD